MLVGGQQCISIIGLVLKLEGFFGGAVEAMLTKNNPDKSRNEIGNTWHLLPIEKKAKFAQPHVVEVAARNLTGEQPHHRDNDIPNNFDLPPTDEEITGIKNHMGHEDQTINTRCTPFRWCLIMKKLFEEQKEVVCALGFGNLLALNCGCLRLKIRRWLVDNFDIKACSIDIHSWRFVINSSVFARVLGISNQRDQISISRDVPNKYFWKSKFTMTSRGIFLKDIKHCLEEMTTTNDEFKLFYLHSLQWEPPIMDKAEIPVVCWTNVKIKKCVIKLHTEEGVGNFGEDFFKQPTPSEGQYDVAAHGETCHANQEPVTGNNVHMKGITDVLQVVKEIQATLKTKLHDIRTKVNLLYAKFNGNTPDLPMEDQRIDDPYYVPPVLTIPSLFDEDTFNDDTLEQESQSSNKRRLINTRSTLKRKPGRYQISLYIAVPVNASTNEVIVDIGHLRVMHKSLRTLEPYKCVDSEIIILIPEYKSMILKSKRSQLSWFLPTNYAYTVFTCTDGKQYSLKKSLSKLRDSYMYDLRKCEKMQSLDIVFADDIAVSFPTTFSFTTFTILDAKAPSQPNGYDCGLYFACS
ncbi:hypothetical protein EZV62_022670 [Acer yangbiense]|uniref:Ubiquitin-like protease family profile domain-containing protein n=1 Tax=Acer yangbiense TaxID=1000413 RepID=A0A5C7H985_9ROSI|nr:hypothetical protein EZV62_022670 [Acer yangbiense]